MSDQELENRLQRVETQLAYADLCSRYTHGVDKAERESFLAIWTENAEWNLGENFGNYSGTEAIAECWENLQVNFHEMHHGTTNLQIIEYGNNSAVGRCDAFVPGTDAFGVANAAAASYVDRLERGKDGLWRFSKRDITVHFLVPWTKPQSIEDSTRGYLMAEVDH
ncbi:MAG: nuclear transport factor 2 family protein [Hyphomicrobiales bacterium]|nr:MAG: nuclear transport factor 2 family protein [Hyphomicrobiales bacterium]